MIKYRLIPPQRLEALNLVFALPCVDLIDNQLNFSEGLFVWHTLRSSACTRRSTRYSVYYPVHTLYYSKAFVAPRYAFRSRKDSKSVKGKPRIVRCRDHHRPGPKYCRCHGNPHPRPMVTRFSPAGGTQLLSSLNSGRSLLVKS